MSLKDIEHHVAVVLESFAEKAEEFGGETEAALAKAFASLGGSAVADLHRLANAAEALVEHLRGPKAEPAPQPERVSESTPAPEAAAEPAPQPEPVAESTPAPEADAEPVAESAPQPEAIPDPVVEATPAPAPAAAAGDDDDFPQF